MSANMQDTLSAIQDTLFGELKKNWGWLLALGILYLVIGAIGLWASFALTLVTILVFGVAFIVGGVFQLIQAFQCKGWKCVLWHILIALLYVACGFVIVFDPILASATLTLVLAVLLIAVGVFRGVLAFQLRPTAGWFWPLLSGLVSVLLGGLIIAQWPMSGFWVIGLFVAVELIFNGWAYVFVALAARKAGKAEASAGPVPAMA